MISVNESSLFKVGGVKFYGIALRDDKWNDNVKDM